MSEPTRCQASVIRGGALGTCYRGALAGGKYCAQHLNAASDPDPNRTWLDKRAEREKAKRLAAAAPDLLAVCRRMARYFQQHSMPELQGIACEMFAAIAKAEGREA